MLLAWNLRLPAMVFSRRRPLLGIDTAFRGGAGQCFHRKLLDVGCRSWGKCGHSCTSKLSIISHWICSKHIAHDWFWGTCRGGHGYLRVRTHPWGNELWQLWKRPWSHELQSGSEDIWKWLWPALQRPNSRGLSSPMLSLGYAGPVPEGGTACHRQPRTCPENICLHVPPLASLWRPEKHCAKNSPSALVPLVGSIVPNPKYQSQMYSEIISRCGCGLQVMWQRGLRMHLTHLNELECFDSGHQLLLHVGSCWVVQRQCQGKELWLDQMLVLHHFQHHWGECHCQMCQAVARLSIKDR